MPEDQPWTGELLDAEQVQLLAEQAMVALFGFLNGSEVLLEIFLVEK